ncbi:hypothetical protein HB691_001677 [Salmonella enterica subsp. enterica]|nr:hypothetical protein [Salmonella enterica subsp. enterica]EEP6389495.1 hypothetical protein [Salmonella enterica subsp. enterica]
MQISQLPMFMPVRVSPHFNGAIVISVVNGEVSDVKMFPGANTDLVNFIDHHALAVERGKKGGRPEHPMKPEALALARELLANSPKITRYRMVMIIAGKLAERSLYAPSCRSLENWIKRDIYHA